jgi:hypothetical protein
MGILAQHGAEAADSFDVVLVTSGLAASAIIMGLVGIYKSAFGMPSKLAPVAAILTGVVLAIPFHYVDEIPGGGAANHSLAAAIVAFALAGFVACGAYSLGKSAVTAAKGTTP